jgi:phosphoribosyl 1,2-cyclic phosphate phosphodiesterase
MKITLLGSGDAIGMPVPLCGCEYCQESEKRRRPGLLVETGETTLVFEISPEIKEQLHEVEIFDVDAFFVTHHHFDHFSGIRELNHIAIEEHVLNPEDFDYNGWHGREMTVYGNQTTQKHLQEKQSHIAENENINFQVMSAGEAVEVGDVTVEAFKVEHGEETQGYVIQENGRKVVYVPDVRNIPEDEDCYEDADIALMEGQLFGAESHGYTEEIEENIEQVNADRTVLVNISEHLNQMHTDKLEEAAEEKGYEVWKDFDSIEV